MPSVAAPPPAGRWATPTLHFAALQGPAWTRWPPPRGTAGPQPTAARDVARAEEKCTCSSPSLAHDEFVLDFRSCLLRVQTVGRSAHCLSFELFEVTSRSAKERKLISSMCSYLYLEMKIDKRYKGDKNLIFVADIFV